MGNGTGDGWVSYEEYEGEKDIYFWYISSTRWVISQLNGRTDLNERRNMMERLFTCVVGVVLAVIAQAVFVSAITKAMLDLSDLMSEKKKMKQRINVYLASHPIPQDVTSSVKRYLDEYFDLGNQKKDEDEVLAVLPRHLQVELLFQVRSPVLTCLPFFMTLVKESLASMRHVCHQRAQTVASAHHEVVFDTGDACCRIFFMDSMTTKYYQLFGQAGTFDKRPSAFSLDEPEQKKKEKGGVLKIFQKKQPKHRDSMSEGMYDNEDCQIIRQGSWICEAALWTDWENKGRLVADDYGLMLSLEAADLALGLKGFPDAFIMTALYAR
jgi:hypothetical protein